MAKALHCAKCGSHVGELVAGSKLRRGVVVMCKTCADVDGARKSFAEVFESLARKGSAPMGAPA